jgi:NAD(P)-dependent dehydrogenase (short-subunit alcohol dehydrogenase family)
MAVSLLSLEPPAGRPLTPPPPFPLILTRLCRIGAAICRALARFPLKALALHYSQSAQAAEDLKDSLNASFPSLVLTLHQADLSQPSQCDKLVQEVLEAHETVDIFISNAGAAKRITDIL